MKKLYYYLNQNVELTDVDGKIWKGYVADYYPAGEIEDEEDKSIILEFPGVKDRCYRFYIEDIKSIKKIN